MWIRLGKGRTVPEVASRMAGDKRFVCELRPEESSVSQGVEGQCGSFEFEKVLDGCTREQVGEDLIQGTRRDISETVGDCISIVESEVARRLSSEHAKSCRGVGPWSNRITSRPYPIP